MQFPSLPDQDEGIHFTSITFDVADVDLPMFDHTSLSEWLTACAKTYSYSVESLSYVLCSDVYLHKMNVERLNHDTLTDIITFDLSDGDELSIDGECYISLERVNDNAAGFGESSEQELRRVFAHGLLHLCGMGDKSPEEAALMRKAEESALQLYDNSFSSTK